MPVDRPTFSESWYRIKDLRPRLRSTVQVSRQHYRGRIWYVLQDPSNNQFYRQNEAAYHFVAMLDGRRTIAEVWDACNDRLGDAAPTQGEVVQLLGQLYTSNLIYCELPPDAQGLFERYRKRIQREVKGYLTNLLFIRIPLFDPDRILDRWVGVVGKAFTVYGFAFWLMLISVGLYFVIGNISALTAQAENVLDPANLPLLYLSFALIKAIHEFGHGFACKKFGLQGGGGEVHTMGIMFLVFTPLPYVDASSAWAFRRKWHRVIVGAGGMIVELAVAAIAAIVWANTQPGTIHAITYNMMFIASVSTLLFNANPLLRFDGYFILSDLLEIPNLSERSKQYIYYLVKRFVYGVRRPRNPAHTNGERVWFVFYGIASTVYRVFICFRILLFVADKLFFVGAILAAIAVVVWVLVPLGKFLHYLATNGELMRTRGRAIASTAGFAVAVAIVIGLIPLPDRFRVEGVVEPRQMHLVFAEANGFIAGHRPSGSWVSPADPVDAALVRSTNDQLSAAYDRVQARRRFVRVSLDQAVARDEPAQAEALRTALAHLDKQEARLKIELDGLDIRPQMAGMWVAPEIDRRRGAYVKRGDALGLVAEMDAPAVGDARAQQEALDGLVIRAIAAQRVGPLLVAEARRSGRLTAVIRAKRRPDTELLGEALAADIRPTGQNKLPSNALGYAAGGSMLTVDQRGTETAEKFFEVRVTPRLDPQRENDADPVMLLPGQRVVVRFNLPGKPLARQAWRWLGQLVQRRWRS